MTLPVYMPLADGLQIPRQTLTGLLAQVQNIYLRPITRPGRVRCRVGEAICRNALLEVAGGLQKQGPACMIDCDVVLTDPHALYDACALLNSDTRLAAVHVRFKTKLTDQHFDIGCTVFRVDAVRALVFPSGETCLCGAFSKYLAEHGFTQRYLDHVRGYELATSNRQLEASCKNVNCSSTSRQCSPLLQRQ